MLLICLFGLVLAGAGSVMGIDPPEFVVEDEGEYIFSVAWQAYHSDLWIDGYLIVNGTSVDSFHGSVQKYNEESVDTFPPYVYSRNVWLNLKPGDIVWIHSEQTDQLANTRLSVQKSTSDKSKQITTVSQPQDCVRAPSISFPVADDEVAVLSDHFTAVESGRYSFTWQLYGTSSSSGFWVRAQVLINGQSVEGTEIQIYSSDYDWPHDIPYYIGGLAYSSDLESGDTVQLFFENPLLIDFVEFNVNYGGWTQRETQTLVENGEFTAPEDGQYSAQ